MNNQNYQCHVGARVHKDQLSEAIRWGGNEKLIFQRASIEQKARYLSILQVATGNSQS
jgi:hypothetical protein